LQQAHRHQQPEMQLQQVIHTLGRKDDIYSVGGRYTGFSNIIVTSNIKPDLATDAPFVNGQYRVCEGSTANVYVLNGGLAYVYHWEVQDATTGATSNHLQRISI
jgi:hypothetical protein